MTTIEMVAEFHKAFQIDDLQRQGLSIRLLQEELNELEQAVKDNDIIEILDALTDLQYILDGSYLAFGLAPVKDEAFEEVHRSNMTKLGEDGQPVRREDGKVIKGPNYQPPNLAQFVQ